jgi:hypothetical protein
LGDFAIAANQVQVKAGQITWLSCFKNQCQLAQSSMLPAQQMRQQGQQTAAQPQASNTQSDQMQQGQQMGSTQQQAGNTAANSGPTNNTANVMFNQMLTSNPDRGLLVVENLSGSDIIFDLTQPEPDMTGSAWVGPSQQQTFLLMPGQHQYSGHQPLGDFAIAANQVQVKAGQITWLSCFKNQCQLAQSSMLPAQQMQQQAGNTQQSGQSGSNQQLDQPSNNSSGGSNNNGTSNNTGNQ